MGTNVTLLSPVMSGGASPSGSTGAGTSPMDPTHPQQQGCPNSVLRVIIENMLYPITLDVLHQASCFWLKVSLFMKSFMYMLSACCFVLACNSV